MDYERQQLFQKLRRAWSTQSWIDLVTLTRSGQRRVTRCKVKRINWQRGYIVVAYDGKERSADFSVIVDVQDVW